MISVSGAGASSAAPRPCARSDKHADGGRDPRGDRGGGEDCQADQVSAPSADPTPDPPSRQQQGSEHERVGIDDPQGGHGPGTEVGADGRDRDIDDVGLHHDQGCA